MAENTITTCRLSDLKLDISNLRGHDKGEIELLVKSLSVFGQFKPLLVDKNTMTVMIGNGRLMAMRRMGWTECECILLDWNGREGMEVVDNRLNELSSWVDSDLDDWYVEKGSDWWGFDEKALSDVEKAVKRASGDSGGKRDSFGMKEASDSPLCPCCGHPLVKKELIILD